MTVSPHDDRATASTAEAPVISSPQRHVDGPVAPAAPRLGSQKVNGMASLAPDLRILAADAAFFQQFGREASDTCGRSLYDLLHPSAPGLLDRGFSRLAEGRRSRFVERVVAVHSTEDVFSAELTGIAVQSDEDRPSAFVVIFRSDGDTSGSAAAAHDDGTPRHKQRLSRMHAQILEGVAGGASTVQLATRLYLSRQGVEYHVGLLLRRYKVPNRAALVARAHSLGMLTVGVWPPRVLPQFVEDADRARTPKPEGSGAARL